MKLDAVINTDGQGYWSEQVKSVRVIQASMAYTDTTQTFGELRIEFDTGTWDVESDGLIYTDESFLAGLRLLLNSKGLNAESNEIDYSEQGMQGDDYVSLDVGAEFIKSWQATTGESLSIR